VKSERKEKGKMIRDQVGMGVTRNPITLAAPSFISILHQGIEWFTSSSSLLILRPSLSTAASKQMFSIESRPTRPYTYSFVLTYIRPSLGCKPFWLYSYSVIRGFASWTILVLQSLVGQSLRFSRFLTTFQ
jgi:hypothetical protein